MEPRQSSYYESNPLQEIARLNARLAIVEKALVGSADFGATFAGREGIFSDAPDAALPDAASFPGLYLLEAETHDIYQLICSIVDGRPRLFLQRVGRSRPEAGIQ